MKTIFHKASERGHANHDWLNTYHSFSFANYFDPEKVNFGLLRVLNDDIISPAMGFGMHPHENMEIITIPIFGTLEHKDSMGNIGVIRPNEIQAMSAGSGLMHAEYNHSKTEEINLLQIWVYPKEINIKPRYDQFIFPEEDKNGKFKTIVSPIKSTDTLFINQDAYFSIGKFNEATKIDYSIKVKNNGAYIFIIEGEVKINNQQLQRRDALGIWDTETFSIEVTKAAEILIIDVPMK